MSILAYPTGDVWDFDTNDEPYKVRDGAMRTRILRPLSRWSSQELPKHCANIECGTKFEGIAWKGSRTGALYCSRHCRLEMSDEPTLEDMARLAVE